ncbi:MAG: hypothetical protein JWQ10_3399 [Herbaspirillum sp.]|jgi:hypothetical protein|nr:hypothetical protein [Herbaspirillum sp.]
MPIPVISPMKFFIGIAQRAGPVAKNTAQGGDAYKGRPFKLLADGNKVGNFLNNLLRFGKTGKIGDSNFSRFGYGRNVVRQQIQKTKKTQTPKTISGTPRAPLLLPIGLLPLHAASKEEATPDDGYATIQEMKALRDESAPVKNAAGAESALVNSEPIYARIERNGLAKVKRQEPAVSESVPPTPPPKMKGLRKLTPSPAGVDSLHSQAASSSSLKKTNQKSVEIPLILSRYRVTIDALEASRKKSSVPPELKETSV